MAEKAVTEEQNRRSHEVATRYIEDENDINSFEDARDVVERYSPHIGPQAKRSYFIAVVSSSPCLQVVGAKD